MTVYNFSAGPAVLPPPRIGKSSIRAFGLSWQWDVRYGAESSVFLV